ncbi:hypothetical protein Nmul_A2252 [Nitrosospira multiformis ATCC 25196]|uniref:Uncharacterized protein n=1 Tax=Nitrosospira multiformis (strain ATCC 25196 / NCIMB 11849 / C 71) TaxID=323848 RepID=Q2Y6S7_NITMU|nr:hypothetical protein Nmul_A2252 [Nitrosospira multiformis ATCC 25196]
MKSKCFSHENFTFSTKSPSARNQAWIMPAKIIFAKQLFGAEKQAILSPFADNRFPGEIMPLISRGCYMSPVSDRLRRGIREAGNTNAAPPTGSGGSSTSPPGL